MRWRGCENGDDDVMPAPQSLCERCGRRYKQDGQLCRSCAKETGAFTTCQAADRAHVAAHLPPPVIVREARPSRTRIVNGVEFEVVWDGSR